MKKLTFWFIMVCFLGAFTVTWWYWPNFVKWHPIVDLKESEGYVVLQALIAIFSIIIALAVYWSNQTRARDDAFNKLQIKEIEHIFFSINEWAILVDQLHSNINGKECEGSFVAKALAEKYRKAELRLLKRIYGNDKSDATNAKAELENLDAVFITDFENAKLKQTADALFRILNLAWATTNLFNAVYRKDRSRAKQVYEFKENIVSVIRNYIDLDWQFVYGKYRHLKWGLDKNKPEVYRGENFADRLFVYERTLIKCIPSSNSVKKIQLDYLAQRNKLLELTETETLDISKLWTLNSRGNNE